MALFHGIILLETLFLHTVVMQHVAIADRGTDHLLTCLDLDRNLSLTLMRMGEDAFVLVMFEGS